MATRLLAVLLMMTLVTACQSRGLEGTSPELPREAAGPGLAEVLEDPNMVLLTAAEVRRYFTGNTVYWEPLGEPEKLYAAYYDPSGERRVRERGAMTVEVGRWRFEGESFCQGDPKSGAESCGSLVAGPDDVLAFCSEAQGCAWLVIGLNEGNSLSL